jgi:hypothetical protein
VRVPDRGEPLEIGQLMQLVPCQAMD